MVEYALWVYMQHCAMKLSILSCMRWGLGLGQGRGTCGLSHRRLRVQARGLWGPVTCKAYYRRDQMLGVSPKKYRVHGHEFEKIFL
jgi:hypothetical protein